MASAKILLYKSNKKKDGSHPVVIQITHEGKSFRLTYYHCLPKYWDFGNNRFRRSFHGYKVKNAILIQELNKVNDAFDVIARSNEIFTKEKFKNVFYKNILNATDTNFFEFLENYITELFEAGKISNRNAHRVARNRLLSFSENNYKLTFSKVNKSFLNKFERFLLKEGRTGGGVRQMMIVVRGIFNKAIKMELVSKGLYPFRTKFNKEGYSFAHLKSNAVPRALSKRDMESLKNFDIEKHKHLAIAHKVFMFSYYCMGINFKDICKLKKADIYNGRINYIRSKTEGIFSIKISPYMQEIMDYFDSYNEFVFPFLNLSYNTPSKIQDRITHRRGIINKQLKEIGKILGINADLTTYVARHSFANALNTSGVSTKFIQKALGHKDPKTTEHYLKKLGDEELDSLSDLL